MFRIESIQRQVFIYNTNIVYGVITYQHTMYDMSTYVWHVNICMTCQHMYDMSTYVWHVNIYDMPDMSYHNCQLKSFKENINCVSNDDLFPFRPLLSL